MEMFFTQKGEMFFIRKIDKITVNCFGDNLAWSENGGPIFFLGDEEHKRLVSILRGMNTAKSRMCTNLNYRPIKRSSIRKKIGYLIEESGEVVQALGKSIRWGFESVNPELPPEEQETNRDWLKRELADFKYALSLFWIF